ncbi:hypothetical protein ACPCG0_02515 [Propionibacteriaceae bacterium Y1923]
MWQVGIILVVLAVILVIRVASHPGSLRQLGRRAGDWFGLNGPPRDELPAPRHALESAQSVLLRRNSAIRSFNQISEQYGALRSDIADYINHYALFDAAVPATAAFDTAYFRLANADMAGMDVSILEAWVADLRATWQRALSHAQRVGAAALGDPKQGARAAKLAARAKSVSGAEFDSTMQALRAILDVLGVVLPRQATQRLEAQHRREISD